MRSRVDSDRVPTPGAPVSTVENNSSRASARPLIKEITMRHTTRVSLAALMFSASCFCGSVFAQEDLSDADEQIIQYHATKGLEDPVARLQKQLAEGKTSLQFETNRGYLPALLRALQIPISSQGLVFSRTSSQGEHCSPKTPRAVFFSDDIYIGWVKEQLECRRKPTR